MYNPFDPFIYDPFGPYADIPEVPRQEDDDNDPLQGRTQQQRDDAMMAAAQSGCGTLIVVIIGFVIAAVISMLTGCTTTRYVPMPEIHEQHHWHSDTIIQHDSLIDRQVTTIREVDSATMAQFGIQLNKAQRAWLVESDRLQREILRLQSIALTKDSVHDSIPYPVEVVKEVPASLSWWQQTRMHLGELLIIVFITILVFKLVRAKLFSA